MATIQISELHPVGYDLLHDSASFLNELDTQGSLAILGGGSYRHGSDHSSYGNSYSGDYSSHGGGYSSGGGYSHGGGHSYGGDYSHQDYHYPKHHWW